MAAQLSVGDFSRMTHLTVKTLRHYHEVGLLEPAAIDPATKYRYYTIEQLGQAQVIRRLRDLDMPVADVKAVLAAHDVTDRNALIAKHLERLETELARTRAAVESLRSLLEPAPRGYEITHRTETAMPAIAIEAVVEHGDLGVWWPGAIAELHATVTAQQLRIAGPTGGLYAAELFQDARGHAVVFIPVAGAVKSIGRVRPFTVPAAELAIVTHAGSHDDVDRAYSELGAYVATHEIGVAGPIREYYLRDPHEHPDPATRLTEIAWPVFRSNG
jgi:DNA-binding transcriptional MerR regulator